MPKQTHDPDALALQAAESLALATATNRLKRERGSDAERWGDLLEERMNRVATYRNIQSLTYAAEACVRGQANAAFLCATAIEAVWGTSPKPVKTREREE